MQSFLSYKRTLMILFTKIMRKRSQNMPEYYTVIKCDHQPTVPFVDLLRDDDSHVSSKEPLIIRGTGQILGSSFSYAFETTYSRFLAHLNAI